MSKLIVIIGITGNQGGSVAQVYLNEPNWRIRGLTRDPSSAASQALTAQGVEMVRADLHDSASLVSAFQGANLIFSVTDFWKPFFDPANVARAEREGITIGQLCYRLEYEQGKNVCDAAAHPAILPGLDATGLVASTLNHATETSQGKFTQLYHFDAKADVFPKYVRARQPALAAKTTYLQTAFFMLSWKYMPQLWPGKQADGKFVCRMATAPDAVVPHLDVQRDTGYYVRALAQLPPGKTVMAAGLWCSWTEWMRQWAKGMGIEESKASFQQISTEAMMEGIGHPDFGKEVAEMYEFATWPGYEGGVKMMRGDDLREMGFEIPMTTVEEYTKREDWSAAMNF